MTKSDKQEYMKYEQFLLNELKRFYLENNKIPCARDMGNSYPSVQAYQNHFGSWNNAIKAAGFRPRRTRVEKIVARPIRKESKYRYNNVGGYIPPRTLAEVMEL